MQAMPEQPVFVVDGNRLKLLDSGPRRLAALLELINSADTSLRLLYYIYVDDSAGVAVRDALAAAAARGVEVSLLVDGLGSEEAAGRQFFEPLAEAGIDVCRFIPRWGRRYLLRNHQKLALADAETDHARVIVGGFNIQDSYFGTFEEQAWRDLGLLVEGPAAARLAGYFDAIERWARHARAPVRSLTRLLRQWSEPEGQPLRWLLGGPSRRLSPWARLVRREMHGARRMDIIASYFAPNPAMLRRLYRVARRGRVRVVVPAWADHTAAIWGARFTYAGLLRNGTEIYEYQRTKLHTKLIVIDDHVHIGSANFDIRSLFLNMELMLRIDDPAFATHIRGYVEGEIADSERITPDLYAERATLWRRMKQAVAYFVMAVLDYSVSRRLNFGERER